MNDLRNNRFYNKILPLIRNMLATTGLSVEEQPSDDEIFEVWEEGYSLNEIVHWFDPSCLVDVEFGKSTNKIIDANNYEREQ